ncbi:hypothetical protein BHS06_17345 [Myxococcus xanthus]|nr:hypothetical protein BHS06_17345 [Myxococcus xanthus]
MLVVTASGTRVTLLPRIHHARSEGATDSAIHDAPRHVGVSGGEAYLHDGRARNLAEAILWHGGEGQAARNNFANMNSADRNALLAFMRSS